MRKGLVLLIFFLVIMLGGGVLTSGLFSGAPIVQQTSDPNGSVFVATPEQAGQFIFWVFFVLANVVGAGLTLAVVMWRGQVEVARVSGTSNTSGGADEGALATTEN